MSGWPQEAAAGGRQEQQEKEGAWVDREEGVMEEREQLRAAPAGRINSSPS